MAKERSRSGQSCTGREGQSDNSAIRIQLTIGMGTNYRQWYESIYYDTAPT